MKFFMYPLFFIFFIFSACSALNVPEKPKLTALVTVNGQAQSEIYVYVYDISQVQLTWDVSYLPDVQGVNILMSRSTNCDNSVASKKLPYVDSASRAALLGYAAGSYNPIENLGVIFQDNLSSITAGKYYVCIKSVANSGSESSPSYPVTVDILY